MSNDNEDIKSQETDGDQVAPSCGCCRRGDAV